MKKALLLFIFTIATVSVTNAQETSANKTAVNDSLKIVSSAKQNHIPAKGGEVFYVIDDKPVSREVYMEHLLKKQKATEPKK